MFFIDTSCGQVATRRQLVGAGVTPPDALPPRPWLRIQGTDDASTMWYAVLRKRHRHVYIGALAMRHTPHHARLLSQGWEEVPVEAIGADLPAPTP